MVRRLLFFGLWLGFIIYAFGFAPPDQANTIDLIKNLSTGQWQGINPLIVALFNIMGLWPMIYACVLCADGRGQSVRAWPFAAASFGVGAFALLPYLGLRHPNPTFTGEKSKLISLLDARWTGRAIALGVLILLGYGILNGNWADFVQQWQTSRFIHVMSLDFCLLGLLFPTLLGDDMARRGWGGSVWFWAFALIPLLGAVTYLSVRPSLPDSAVSQGDTMRYDDPVRSL